MKFAILLLSYLVLIIDAQRIKIHTWSILPGPPLYHMFPLKSDYLEFNVKGEKDIKILLTNSYDLEPPCYEIVIGAHDNTVSLIRKSQEGAWVVTHHEAILAKNEFQKIWVSINDTEESISVGKRRNEPFLYYKDPNYVKMGFFGLSNGSGAEALWDFDMYVMKWDKCEGK